ncbi:lantibiotic dehydratase [Clostridium rectalis]|uniref:lantibiotic dehydratase n=1 Tax=Clostridium rectalis TaxID=2040295 RepID=UPI000F642960|nr:lantibiotic dehydratase [Clostridium rectalis]
MKKNVYENINTFMIRTPTLPIEKFFDFFNEQYEKDKSLEEVRILCNNPIFRESILIGSPNLYNTLTQFAQGKSIKKQGYFLQSIYKYLIRISTRPTPFGLFSGVDFGTYNNYKTIFQFSDNKYKKYVRPDMKWLVELVKYVEKKEYINLKFRTNDSIFLKGDRAFLLYTTRKKEDDSIEEISVRLTGALEKVLVLAKKSISYKELMKRLIENYGYEYNEKIQDFLINLIENEYLISNLMPPLTVEDQFDYIINEINKLNNDCKLVEKLKKVKKMINEYMETDLGEGEELYKTICHIMKNIVACKSLLQVDMKLNLKEKTINSKVIDEINDLLNILLTLAIPYRQKDSYFERYKQQFIENYCHNREVPLLEMLDNDRGIGAPADYMHPESNRYESTLLNNEVDNKIKRYFSDKYIEAIKNNKHITITDKEIKKLQLDEYSYEELPNSLEINLIVKTTSKDKEENKYRYYLGPNLGSNTAGKSFGRFSYMMEEEKKCFNNIAENELERTMSNDYITCELVYLPNRVRIANVARNIHGSDYELALFTNSSKDDKHKLSLDDILIGLDNNKFYAKSKSLNKKLVITMNNMLNTELAPNAIRFLSDINYDGKRSWFQFPWKNILKDSIFIPKVQYKNFIISPSIWRINKEFLGVSKKTSFEDFKNKVETYFKKYNIPKYIYITLQDNRTLLNTKDNRCLKILQHEINNNQDEVVLNSYEDGEFNIAIDSEDKEYLCEVVIPLVKVRKEGEKLEGMENTKEYIPSLSEHRLKLPFDQWLYLKLYGVTSNIDDLIGFYISEYCREKVNTGEVYRYFFMRYADPVPHIRLRLNSSRTKLLDLYPELQVWLKDLISKGLISKYNIDAYDREIERYGGLELMDVAETVFYFDSMVVEDILREVRLKNLGFSRELIGMVSIIHYMDSFKIKYEEQVSFLRTQVKSSDYRDDFNKNRDEYIKLCNSSDNWRNLRELEEGVLLLNILDKRMEIVREYGDIINNNLQKLYKLSILDSIIHLHCNRLYGIDRDFEKKVRALTSHALYALKYFKNKEKKNYKF